MARINHQNVESLLHDLTVESIRSTRMFLSYNVKSPCRENVMSVGSGKRSGTTKKHSMFFCTDENCLKTLESVEDLQLNTWTLAYMNIAKSGPQSWLK